MSVADHWPRRTNTLANVELLIQDAKMFDFYLAIIINVFLLWAVIAGTRYFEEEERRERASQKAKRQFRWADGTFAKKRTLTDLWNGR